jgi:hypothetical protein
MRTDDPIDTVNRALCNSFWMMLTFADLCTSS